MPLIVAPSRGATHVWAKYGAYGFLEHTGCSKQLLKDLPSEVQ